MLNNSQTISVINHESADNNVKCKNCGLRMIQLKTWEMPSFVCASCGTTLKIETKKDYVYEGNLGRPIVSVDKIVWGECSITDDVQNNINE